MSMFYLGKHGNAKVACFNFICCVNGSPELLLLDFFNIADMQLKFMMQYYAVNLVMYSFEFTSGLWGLSCRRNEALYCSS